MYRIQNLKHPKEIIFYCISRLLERASYFGFRALIVLYMIGETLQMESADALALYGWLSASLIFTQIIGALFGDLIIGNKNSIILGGLLQAIGAFVLCIPSMAGLYAGLLLVVIGSGLYTPNIISNFGKLYLDKTKLLDGGFTIFYTAINIGAMIGAILCSLLQEQYGFRIGFAVSGILMLLSLIPLFLIQETTIPEFESSKWSIDKRFINISIACILLGLFWGIYELSNYHMMDIQLAVSEISLWDIPKSYWYGLNGFFLIPISLIAAIIWSLYYSSQSFKLMIGFILTAIAFGLLFIIPEAPNESHIAIYLISIFILALSEIHIAQIIYSILTKYSNPKYLAIIISLSFIPIKLFTGVINLLNFQLHERPSFALKYGFITISIIAIGLMVYVIWNKKFSRNLVS